MRVRLCLMLFAASLALSAPAGARAEIYAVVIGVDAYERLPKLNGAANDARDLAAALERLGAEVELIVDKDATRKRVLDAFRRQAGRAGPGDLFVFTYAGHGLQEKEAIAGDEADGLDETIVFAGFDWVAERAGERLRDNEIGELLATIDPEARTLIVIDSCHSGTMTRAADPRGRDVKTRFGGFGRISQDPLPKPNPDSKGKDIDAAQNFVFVAAARDDEQIPEVEIDGAMRGAVSWTVARALDGGTDFGGPGMPLSEFRAFVRAQARALAAARQTPSVTVASTVPLAARVIPLSAMRSLAAAPQAERRIPAGPVRVYAINGAAIGDLGDAGRFVDTRETADLVWDVAAGELIDRSGADLVAEAFDVGELSRALAKWRAAKMLTAWALRRHVEFLIEPDDGRHRIGETIELSVARPAETPAYLTLVNLASSGETQFVFPDAANRAQGLDKIQPGEGYEWLGEVRVSHPIGADHVVAIYSPARPETLHAWLERGDGDAEDFVALLRAEASANGYSVGVTPIFTQR